MLLNAIIIEIERYRSEDFSTIGEAKRFFRLVAIETKSESTQPDDNKIERKAISEERDALCKFIEQLNEEDLFSLNPLFYSVFYLKKKSIQFGRN